MEELGSRFDSKLRLTKRERKGITIDRNAMERVLLRFQYTLVAEVLTFKDLHGESFIDCFMSLWRGRDGVSIRDLGDRRFLEGFIGHGDQQRVMDVDQPRTFKGDLVLGADKKGTGLNKWA